MPVNTYDVNSLSRALFALEERYGMSSAEFYDAYLAGSPPEGIPRFYRHAWASFYREARPMLREAETAE